MPWLGLTWDISLLPDDGLMSAMEVASRHLSVLSMFSAYGAEKAWNPLERRGVEQSHALGKAALHCLAWGWSLL